MKLEDLFDMPTTERKFEREEIFVPKLISFIEKENEKEVDGKEDAVFRASGLGYCGRFLLYKLDDHLDAKTYRDAMTLEFGTAIHEIIQRYIAKMPEGESSEDEVTIEEIPNVNGHYDYVLVINGKRYLLEIKSSNVEAYQRLATYPQPYAAHKKQATFYMKSLDIDETIFLYVNKNGMLLKDFAAQNPDVNPYFLEIRYKYDPNLYEEIKEFVEDLTNHKKDGTMPKYKKVSQCDWCQFASICAIDRKEEAKERRAAKKKQS